MHAVSKKLSNTYKQLFNYDKQAFDLALSIFLLDLAKYIKELEGRIRWYYTNNKKDMHNKNVLQR